MSGPRPAHLGRRGATYIVRFRIPSSLRAKIGMIEFTRSLHTSDHREARHRCLRATCWFRETVDKLDGMTAPSRTDLESAALEFFNGMVATIDQREGVGPEHLADEVDFNVIASRNRIAALDAQLLGNQFDGMVAAGAADLLAHLGQEPAAWATGAEQLPLQLSARIEREQLLYLVHRLTHPVAEYTGSDPLLSGTSPQSSNQTSQASAAARPMTLQEAAGTYLKLKASSGVKGSHIEELARALGWLQERFGGGRPLSSITKKELATFRTDIGRRRNSQGTNVKVPFGSSLTDNPELQIKSVSAVRYWRSIQGLFAWALEEDNVVFDPAAGLSVLVKSGEEKRSPEPFSSEELQRFFKTPLYAGYQSAKRVSTPGDCVRREGHWWAGVILLFTGMRAAEVAQLLPEDFVFTAPIPYLQIRRENAAGIKAKSVKNENSVRRLALAPPLMQLGIEQFVSRRAKNAKGQRIFREFRLGAGSRNSDGMTKFWGDYLRRFALWKPGRATHVWRHTVIACLRAHEIPEEDIQAYVGHKRQTVTAGYGGDFPLARMAKTAMQLNYGFDVVEAAGGFFDPARHI